MNVFQSITSLMTKGWVEFPNLFGEKGLRIPINDTAFTVGSFEIRWYGVIICIGVLICITLGMKTCNKHGLTQDDLIDYILFAIPSAIIGARAYYVIFEWEKYADDWKSIFNYTEGGLAIYGGVIAAMIAVFCVAKYKKQSFVKIAGFAMPFIILGQAIGRWGNFFNQEAFGGPTTLPWGMNGNEIEEFVHQQVMNGVDGYSLGTLVHPTFLYESLWCFAAFAFMMVYRKKWEKTESESLCLYMILYGIERTFVEGLRTDSLYIGNIRVSQLLSAVIVIVGTALYIDIKRKNKKLEYETGVIEESVSGGLENVVEKMKILEEDNADSNEIKKENIQEDGITANGTENEKQ